MAGQKGAGRSEHSAATMTVVQAAKRLGIGRNQAYQAVHAGKIPALRIGQRWLIPRAALDRMLSGEAATVP
jgi:excisionase family DNA binding protein